MPLKCYSTLEVATAADLRKVGLGGKAPQEQSLTYKHWSEGLVRTRLFHPSAHEPEGGGDRAPAFRIARCWIRTGVRVDCLDWVPSGHASVLQGPVWVRISIVHHGARRIARLSRIGAPLMYGPIQDPTASPLECAGDL